jgi:glycosyltransferase involved in cell wall biosynthesis
MCAVSIYICIAGIGEYIHPLKCKSEYVMPFEIAENAVVVNIPTPEVIADVVKMLILNSTLRAQLGESGYDIVRQDFTVRRQIEEYESLYVNIHASSSTKEKCN